jgi:prepilin-type N-terminal cleavage/methylation domain-containing protein
LHAKIPATFEVNSSARRRTGAARGFTLVETMVATVLLSMMILGILQVMIGSYRVAAKARYNDHARYIIKSFADQFLTQSSTDLTTGAVLPLFIPTPTGTPTGVGLTWVATSPSGVQSTYTGAVLTTPTSGGLQIPLSDATTGEKPIYATVSFEVWNVDPSTGATSLNAVPGAAGELLRGDFTVTYQFKGATITQTISALRATP